MAYLPFFVAIVHDEALLVLSSLDDVALVLVGSERLLEQLLAGRLLLLLVFDFQRTFILIIHY